MQTESRSQGTSAAGDFLHARMTELPPLDSRALYRVLAESATDAIVAIDDRSLVLSVNPAGEGLFGYPADELIGKSLSALMPERFRAGHRAGMTRYLATGRRNIPWQAVRVAILHREGHEVPVEISFGEFESGGRHIFSAIIRDITDRITAEAALEANADQLQTQATELEQQVEEAQVIGEELEQTNTELHQSNVALDVARREAEEGAARVREVLESLDDAVSVFDHEWRWTFVNGSAKEVLRSMGKDADGVLGKVLWDVLPELAGTLFDSETRRAVETNSPVTYEEHLSTLDRWFENRIVPSPRGVTTFSRDVTAAHHAADVLRTREQEYRALANSIPTLAWMAQPDGWIFWYNDRWYEYTGTMPVDMEGWGWQSVHHPDTLPQVLEEWVRSIELGAPFQMTFPLRGADGDFRPFLTRVFPLRDERGGVVRWFGTNTDVSLEHAAREAAEESARRTRRLQKLTSQLARARSVEDVASVVIGEAAQSTGAATGMLAMRVEGTDEVMMVGESGLPETLKQDYQRFPVDRDSPTAECIRTASPVFIGTRDGPDGLLERYPGLRQVWDTVGRSAVASIPLLAGDGALGAMSFTFNEPQPFDEDDRDFFVTLAAQGAQAILRVEAFESERRERKRSESIVESITDGFVAVAADLSFTYVNARAASMFGLPREELLARALDTLPRAENSPFVQVLRDVIARRAPIHLEAYGTIMGRWLEVRGYPVEDGGAIAFFQDITDRRRQQEASAFLAEASRLLGSSPDYHATLRNLARAAIPRLGDWCAVDLLDEQATADAPPRLQRVALVHDDPRKIALGEEYASLYPPDLTDEQNSASAQALTGRSVLIPDISADVIAARVRDERQRSMLDALGLVSAMVVPLSAAGRVLGTITFCTGESRRHYDDADLALAENLAGRAATVVEHARLLERAEAANAAKSEFLRTVSHELRQPLNAIGGLLQLWELGLRGDFSEQQHQDLQRIKRNQQQLSSLIEDLLSFARLEAGKLEVERAPVVVNEVLDGLSAAMSLELETKGVVYKCTLADPELKVLGDSDRLHQVLVNLVTNAMKATESGGRIDISCTTDGGSVGIHVRDSGMGIPVDMLEAIFTPFVQVGRALNHPREGAGLGLAISRGLAEAMGGTLTATSILGEGSTFTLSVPRAR